MKEKNGKTINSLMRIANEKMIINKYLKNKIDFYKKHIDLTKNTMTKCFSDKNNSSTDLVNAYINEIQKDYDILKNDIEKNYNLKYKALYDECLSDITMGKPVLNQMQNEEFSLEYLKMKSNDIINVLKKSIKQSREYHLFREPRRDSLVDNKKGNKEIEKLTTELQQNMLYECKKYNKFFNKVKKYEFQKNELNKNIELIKMYMDTEKVNVSTNKPTINRPKNKGLFKPVWKIGDKDKDKDKDRSKSKNKNNSDENRGNLNDKKNKKKKSTKDIIKGFKRIEDLFDISSEEEKIIDDELHSDDESVFENRISQPVQLSKTYLYEVRQFIPHIDLTQIEFNKLKIIGEADLYSLQRRKYKNQNIDGNIKDFKKKIEKINDKLTVIKIKENAMKNYLEKCKENYETLRPLRMQTSVYKKEIKFIKKSLFGEDDKIDELSDDEGGVGSDYGNEQKEDSDTEKKKKFAYKNKNNLKDTIAIPMSNRFNTNKKEKKQLKRSVRYDVLTNKLKAKIMDDERANSK